MTPILVDSKSVSGAAGSLKLDPAQFAEKFFTVVGWVLDLAYSVTAAVGGATIDLDSWPEQNKVDWPYADGETFVQADILELDTLHRLATQPDAEDNPEFDGRTVASSATETERIRLFVPTRHPCLKHPEDGDNSIIDYGKCQVSWGGQFATEADATINSLDAKLWAVGYYSDRVKVGTRMQYKSHASNGAKNDSFELDGNKLIQAVMLSHDTSNDPVSDYQGPVIKVGSKVIVSAPQTGILANAYSVAQDRNRSSQAADGVSYSRYTPLYQAAGNKLAELPTGKKVSMQFDASVGSSGADDITYAVCAALPSDSAKLAARAGLRSTDPATLRRKPAGSADLLDADLRKFLPGDALVAE